MLEYAYAFIRFVHWILFEQQPKAANVYLYRMV